MPAAPPSSAVSHFSPVPLLLQAALRFRLFAKWRELAWTAGPWHHRVMKQSVTWSWRLWSWLIIGAAIVGVIVPKLIAGTAPIRCLGDCNDDGRVTVNEIITLINAALDRAPLSSCPHNWPPP